MKIKVGDNVKVITGQYKGTTGKVIKTFKNEHKVVVEGVNVRKRHVKPNQMNQNGGIFDVERPIDVSNVKLVETKKEKKDAKKEVKEAKTEKAKKTSKKAK